MAETVRVLEPSRTRPGVLHEVLLRLEGDDATSWTCGCEDHAFGGPDKRGEIACYHVVAAVAAVQEARGRPVAIAGKPSITPWREPPARPIEPLPIESSLERRARAAALALLFHGDAADGDTAAELTRRVDAWAGGDSLEEAFLPDLVAEAERRAQRLADAAVFERFGA
jgi:hypothetical protein